MVWGLGLKAYGLWVLLWVQGALGKHETLNGFKVAKSFRGIRAHKGDRERV